MDGWAKLWGNPVLKIRLKLVRCSILTLRILVAMWQKICQMLDKNQSNL